MHSCLFWLLTFTSFLISMFWIGWIVSTLLAGATIGSFTGGTLADKFGRTKTFVLDAIPLTVGAFLWSVLLSLMEFHYQYVYCRWWSQVFLNFQRHSPKCADNDSRALPCGHWNRHLFCHCAIVHIWGCNFSLPLCVFGSILNFFAKTLFMVRYHPRKFVARLDQPTNYLFVLGFFLHW